MSKKLETIQILFTKRNARSKGISDSRAYNDTLDELSHDLVAVSDQWNNRLTPLTATIPDGTGDITDLNAFSAGLDGKTLLVNAASTSTSDVKYFNTSNNRPNSSWEQFTDVYNTIAATKTDLQSQISNLAFTANDITVIDSAGLIIAENVEDALAEIVTNLNNISGLGGGIEGQITFYDDTGTLIGSTDLTWNDTTKILTAKNLSTTTFTAATLTATNSLALQEQAGSPVVISGKGQLYTKTSDKRIYFKDSADTEFILPVGTGSSNQLAYWTDADDLSSTSNVTYDGTNLIVANTGRLDPQGSGSNSIKIGSGADASATNSIALGSATLASQLDAVALGRNATASALQSLAFGYYASGTNTDTISLGSSSSASAADAIAIGNSASSSVDQGVAIGKSANAANTDAIALGTSASITGLRSIAIGPSASSIWTDTVAIGRSVVNNSNDSIAIGRFASVGTSSQRAIAIGDSAVTSSSTSGIAIGSSASAGGDAVIAIGRDITSASAHRSVVIGDTAIASATDTVSIGTTANASSLESVAIGINANVTSSAVSGIAIGSNTRCDSPGAVAIGAGIDTGTATDVLVIGGGAALTATSSAVVLGPNTSSTANDTVSIGTTASVAGTGGVGIASNASVFASAASGIAIGISSLAGTNKSIAFGSEATVSGQPGTRDYSMAFGANANATTSGQMMIGGDYSNPDTHTGVELATYKGYTLIFTSGDSAVAGDLIAIASWGLPTDASSLRVVRAVTGTSPRKDRVLGICTAETVTSGQNISCMTDGLAQVNVLLDTYAHGDALVTSSTPGKAEGSSSPITGSTVGYVWGDYTVSSTRVWAKVGARPDMTIPVPTSTPVNTTQTIDWNEGESQIVDLESATGDVILTLINPRIGNSYILKIIQDSTLARDIIWPSSVKWKDGVVPVISTGANAEDIISLWWDGTSYYSNAGQDYS